MCMAMFLQVSLAPGPSDAKLSALPAGPPWPNELIVGIRKKIFPSVATLPLKEAILHITVIYIDGWVSVSVQWLVQ